MFEASYWLMAAQPMRYLLAHPAFLLNIDFHWEFKRIKSGIVRVCVLFMQKEKGLHQES